MDQTADIGVVPGYTHDHKKERPDDDACIRTAEEEGKNEKYRNKQHAAYGNIPEQGYYSDGQRDADQRRNGKTVKHDTACGRHSFSAAEMEENRPVMANHTEESGQQ